jgi:Fur family ferric uptake transcriptional regulator
VCSNCHRVVEVEECGLDEWLNSVTARHGFVPIEHHVEITGLCASCR